MERTSRLAWLGGLGCAVLCACEASPPPPAVVDASSPAHELEASPDLPSPAPEVAEPSAEDAATDIELTFDSELGPDDALAPDAPAADLPPPPLPWAPSVYYQLQLPEVTLDADGESEDLFVDLPAPTTVVFVMVRSEIDSAFFTLKTVLSPPPLNKFLVKGAGDAVCLHCANRVSAAQKVAAFLIPNDPTLGVGGGTWTFKLRSTGILKTAFETTYPPQPGVAEVLVLARQGPIPESGRLRLVLHFTGSAGLNAATAPEDPRLQDGLTAATGILAAAGIALEVAGYQDVPGVESDPTLLDLQSTLGQPNDLSKLLLLGQDQDLMAVSVFFVNTIYQTADFVPDGQIVLGIAAGVPGPAFLGPTYRSGVVIATSTLDARTNYFGNVIAHEIGHYLGLYHTTEKDGTHFDTLSDTAEGDDTNLMHWAYSPAQQQISPMQAIVLRSHPHVLPEEE